jgi:bacteriorhodopsin
MVCIKTSAIPFLSYFCCALQYNSTPVNMEYPNVQTSTFLRTSIAFIVRNIQWEKQNGGATDDKA